MLRGLSRFWQGIWEALASTAQGMWVTLRNLLFEPTITLQYPEERWDTPPGYRGMPVLLSDAVGNLKCVACELCAKECPVSIIYIRWHRDPESRKKVLDGFDIDMSKCMFCGFCAEVCPADAIAMSDQYELADFATDDLWFDRERLAAIGRGQVAPTENYGIKTAGAGGARSGDTRPAGALRERAADPA